MLSLIRCFITSQMIIQLTTIKGPKSITVSIFILTSQFMPKVYAVLIKNACEMNF